MRVLVTGAKGFVGRNLCMELRNIMDGKARNWGAVRVEQVFEYDVDSSPEDLDRFCRECDFVFNLAGVNRPQNAGEFMEGNFGFASALLDTLEKFGNRCPVMLSSSQQASLCGRFGNSEYGRSKLAGEQLFLEYGRRTGARVLVYRFPNLFGKWCRPNYNSAVATFCNNIACGLPIQVNDPGVELELLYIDDLIGEMMLALEGREHRCRFNGLEVVPEDGGNGMEQRDLYCYCPVTFKVTLGRIVELLYSFRQMSDSITVPELPRDGFEYRLMSTYLSYLPADRAIFDLKMNVDARGSFTELVRTRQSGQVSVNISKPGITKGQHWHHSKWEQFIVVQGQGLIQMRPENPRPDQLDADGRPKILEYRVSGDRIQSVIMLPGYTHNIINLSDTQDLITVMYCNEPFDPSSPDTYSDPV